MNFEKIYNILHQITENVKQQYVTVSETYIKEIKENIINIIKEYYYNPNKEIVWINEWHKKDDPEFDLFPKHGIGNTEGAEVIASVLYLDHGPGVEGFTGRFKAENIRAEVFRA